MKLISGSTIAQGISLLLAPVLSRLFTPEDFGLVALYLSILSVLSVISTAKYEQAIMLPHEDKDAVHIFWLVLAITAMVSLLTATAVILFNTDLARLTGNPAIAPWLYLLPFSLLMHGLFQSATYYANRNKQFGMMASCTIAQYTILNAVRVLTGWFKAGFNGLIAGQLAGQLLSAFYMTAGVSKSIKASGRCFSRKDMFEQAKKYSGYPKFNLPLNFTNNLSGSLPIFMLTWGFSPAIAGLFAFGFTFVFRPIGMFSQSTMQVFSQKVIEKYHHGMAIYPSLRKLIVRLLVLAVIPVTALAIYAPAAFSIIFSDEYTQAGTILQYLSPYLLIVFITSPLSFIPELYFRQKKAMVIDIVYLVLRLLALGAGIYANNLYLALTLFSLVSTLVVGYNLFWYLSLAKQGDKNMAN